MKINKNVHIKFSLPIITLIAIVIGIYASSITGDPHWLNRMGALIASIAALAILLQIAVEINLEEKRSKIDSKELKENQKISVSPVDELQVRLEIKRFEIQRRKLTKERLLIASYVTFTAMLGELLHGFGDLLMCSLFHICSNH
ncbi:MAG: hypothetical protein ABUK01_11340 [Leptospirales bacterium]